MAETKKGQKTERKENAPVKPKETSPLFAVVRIRSSINVNMPIKDTMNMLRLRRINNCVVVPDNETSRGMLKKAENFLTWGEIDQQTLEKVVWKRGRLPGDKRVEKAQARTLAQNIIKNRSLKDTGIKNVFRLTPPSKGHKPVKRLYPKGACGYRGKHINELLKRMI